VPNNVLIADLNSYFLLPLFFKVFFYLRREKPDIFVSTFPRFNLINILAKSFSGTKTKLVIIEQTTPSQLWITAKSFLHKIIAYFFLPSLIEWLYPKSSSIIAVSQAVKEDLARFIGKKKKIEVIYNPIINDDIYKLAKETINHSWFLDKKIPVIISAGRFVKAKDYPTLLRAFAKLLKKRKARLFILGQGEDKREIEKLIKNLELEEKVLITDFQKNPYKYFYNSSVFVVSSQREGFSNVIVEAMACGLPVISTNCSGPKEIITDGKNGILVPIGDENSLAQAIIKVLDNPSLKEKLIREGKKRAEDFSIAKSVAKYEKIFQELLK
jgi:glycosyltransferase involved in cell wall biosynthesis